MVWRRVSLKIYYYCEPYKKFGNKSNGLRLAYEIVFYLDKYGYDARCVIDADDLDIDDYPSRYRAFLIGRNALNLDDEDIVIYSEIIHGNPLNAKRVIRHIMNRIGAFSFERYSFGPADFCVTYNSAIDSMLPVFYCQKDEIQLFENIRSSESQSGKKKAVSIYFGKVRYEKLAGYSPLVRDICSRYEKVNIITRKVPADREEMLCIVRDSDFLISFDALTNLNYESTLVGTPVLLLDDYFCIRNEIEINHYGFAFDVSELDKAYGSLEYAWEEYIGIIKNQGKDFHKIIDAAVAHFTKIASDTDYAERYAAYIDTLLKGGEECESFECIDYVNSIPFSLRRKLGLGSDAGINLKSEVKYFLHRLHLYNKIQKMRHAKRRL